MKSLIDIASRLIKVAEDLMRLSSLEHSKVSTFKKRSYSEIELPYKYGYVEIRGVDYHRGMIPCPYGTIYLSEEVLNELKNILREGLNKIGLKGDEYVDYLMRYGDIPDGVRFGSSFIEYLYPGSPDLGHHIHIRWLSRDESYEDLAESFLYDIWGELEAELGRKLREDDIIELAEELQSYINKFIEEFDNRIGEAEDVIWKWIKEEERRIEEEYKKEEEEES